MLHILSFVIKVVLSAAIFVGAFFWFSKPPEYLLSSDETVHVPSSSVHFYADTTWVNDAGEQKTKQEIWDRISRLIDKSEQFMVLDFFLINNFQLTQKEESPRLGEMTQHLANKKKEHPQLVITLITDPINDLYGGDVSSGLSSLEEAGVVVVRTNLSKLRDSNRFWTAIWRSFFGWWGNSSSGGWLDHPFAGSEKKVTMRSWAALLNFKANHRRLIVADEAERQKDGTTAKKMVTIITSSNPSNASSTDGNVALEIRDGIWESVLASERNVARLSDITLPALSREGFLDAKGDIAVTLLRERYIKEKVLALLASAKRGDTFSLAMHYLSDRDVVNSLVTAANRGAVIRVLLDPNNGVFVFEKNGIPNRPVAKELIHNSGGSISVRWCDTHGEECHAKLFMGKTSSSTFLLVGSADFTRRNLENFNLETSVIAESPAPFTAWSDANNYFDTIWENKGGKFSVDYATYKDSTFWKSSLYRMMERTGFSSF
jgi:hypothetical protein